MNVEAHAAGFVRALRQAGISVPIGSSVLFFRALGEVGMVDGDTVYWAARATLLHRPEDVETFDAMFRAWWYHDVVVLQKPTADV